MMKKNEQFIGICSDLTENGLGVVRKDGFCFFVKDCLPSEEVEVHITAVKKNFGFGIVKQRLTTSPFRVAPRCSVFKQCGGCQLQHLNYSAQLDFKRKRVEDCFKRIGKIEVEAKPCLGMSDPWNYRNKVQVPVSVTDGIVRAGFYRNNTHDIVEYDTCHVQTNLQNEIIQFFKKRMIDLRCEDVFRHLLIKHAHHTNEVMVVMIVKKYPFYHAKELADECIKEFPQIKSVLVNINEREDNVILGNQEICLAGSMSIMEECDGLLFNISSKSFYQINPSQTQILYRKAIELAELTGNETVADVYCGTGTIGIFASRYAKKVIGIEIIASAIEDACCNARKNQIDNIDFICGDAGACTQRLAEAGTTIDVAIVDPPRKGLDKLTINALVQMSPQKIVYVSCDPATLARDCACFNEKNYHVIEVQPIDLFPHTVHVESVVLLLRGDK